MSELFGSRSSDNDSEWISISDLMAGLMVIFLFIAVVFIRPLAEQNLKIKEIARTWQENESLIYEALVNEFRDDLPNWNAEIEKDTLLVRFKSPEVLFETGKAQIKPQFADILLNFFPRYVHLLKQFETSIEEIRIEGHTSSAWNADTNKNEAYFLNMNLSQERTRAVLQFVLELPSLQNDRNWLVPLLTANGLSSSRVMIGRDNLEDKVRSRRVEFRVRTKARREIVRILEAAK